jgi:hypothetical protein
MGHRGTLPQQRLTEYSHPRLPNIVGSGRNGRSTRPLQRCSRPVMISQVGNPPHFRAPRTIPRWNHIGVGAPSLGGAT